ncbi:MAG TPA: cytochrome c3 family protein [Vicinamibacterales bacterium]|nr:cytochrome c3 family protein [Vicinamibacterales bacterium]
MTSRPVMHGPVAAGQCSACHEVTSENGRRRVALKTGSAGRDTSTLCLTCHTDMTERLSQPHRHAPVAAGHCTACHDPHGSPFRFQLPAEGTRTCTTCHEDIAQALGERNVHTPAAASCQICHDPHAAGGPAQLRTAGNALCMTCHFDAIGDAQAIDVRVTFGRHPHPDLDSLIASGRRIRFDASRAIGHPTQAHPVDAREDPKTKGRTLGCASCHNPHGSPGAKLFRFRATNVSALCVQCHSF